MRALALGACLLISCGRTAAELGDASPRRAPLPEPRTQIAPDAPRNVRASTDDPHRILVTFEAPLQGQPDGYRVLRDGLVVAALPAEARSWSDVQAEPGAVGAPAQLEASQQFADRVELQWRPPTEVQAGRSHTYAVVAVQDGSPSESSLPAVGRRSAPVIHHYELSTDGERSWTRLPGASTRHVDMTAPAAQVEPGQVYLKPLFVPAGMVRMEVQGSGWSPAEVFYRVRAVTAAGPGESSQAALGFRASLDTPLRYQWQRSRDATADVFEDLPGVTGPSWFDASLPPDTERHYRVRVSFGDEASAFSAPARVRTQPAVSDATTEGPRGCVVTDGGKLRCWGNGALEALDGPFRQVSTAAGRICALQTDGRMRCWGGPRDSYTPAGPSADAYRYITLVSGASCWIRADDSRIGCGSFYPFPSAPEGSFQQLSADHDGVCGILSGGGLVCTGRDGYRGLVPSEGAYRALHYRSGRLWAVRDDGRLLTLSSGTAEAAPVGSEGARYVATGAECALTHEGVLHCWPRGPAQAAVVVEKRRYRSLGRDCAIRTDGKVDCANALWSDPLPLEATGGREILMLQEQACLLSAEHQLLCANRPRAFEPLPEEQRPTHVRAVSDSWDRVCAVHTDGRLQCWLKGSLYGRKLPVLPADARYANVVQALDMICGLQLDGRLRCASSDQVDLAPAELSDARYVELQAGFSHVCALDERRRVACWGRGPAALPPKEAHQAPVLAMGVGDEHVCVVRADEQRVCWGDNSSGQAPRGPSQSDLTTLAAGAAHTCGLTATGAVQCWGAADSWAPPSLGRYQALASNMQNTCALRDDGKLVCWGALYRAQDGKPIVSP